MNSTYEFTLKEGPKVKIKKNLGTKSLRNFLEGLKQKVDIFIETKKIFKPKQNYNNFFFLEVYSSFRFFDKKNRNLKNKIGRKTKMVNKIKQNVKLKEKCYTKI